MYLGEYLNGKLLVKLNKSFAVIGAIFGLTVAALAISTFIDRGKTSSMKEEIKAKTEAVAAARLAAAESKKHPQANLPKGLAAISAFQDRINKLAKDKGALVAQFTASDQMVPYISAFSVGTQSNGSWVQVEVKTNIQGTTPAVINTLRDMNSMGIPFEFTTVEMSRTVASPTGEASVTANISLRILTIPGGA